jgi:lipopolysaccharide transport system ATP-binding protein
MSFAVKVENLSKAYQLGTIGTGTLGNDLKRWYALARGKEDPFLKIGETNDRSVKGESGVVWSLKDINFEIEQGDAVGIIGKNGAGKSTLLKILSRVTGPTTGKVRGNGRVASLLEVGTGFHPELTGKDNIYLNGAILGMRKKEITRKFDEIVDFAGVERYIDTPVKRYSSGMYVRLAFAVAAYLESEILVVDEVLAVGDAEFQKKCLGKMGEVQKGEGRTILFVSHNMAAILRLCRKTIFLQNGLMIKHGLSERVVEDYLKEEVQLGSRVVYQSVDEAPGNDLVKLISAEVVDVSLHPKSNFYINEKVGIKIVFEIFKKTDDLICGFNLYNSHNIHILTSHDHRNMDRDYAPGIYQSIVWLPKNFLAEGLHYCGIAALSYKPFTVHFHDVQKFVFNISDAKSDLEIRNYYTGDLPGVVRPTLEWDEINKLH